MSARPRRAPGHCIVGTRMAFTTCSCGIRSIFLYSRNYFFGHCAEAERQDNLGKIGLHNTKKETRKLDPPFRALPHLSRLAGVVRVYVCFSNNPSDIKAEPPNL